MATHLAQTDAVPALVWFCDEGGRATHVNLAWTATTGQSPEEALGSGWLDALHPQDRADWARLKACAHEAEWRIRRASDGAYRWHWVAIAPAEGGFVAVATDFHALKMQEAAHVASRARQEMAARAAGIGFWTRDLVLNRATGSEQMLRLLGLPLDTAEFDFERWTEAVHPDDRLAVQESWWRSLETHGAFESEHRVLVRGQTRWIQVAGRIIEMPGGRPTELTGIAIDITERKNREGRAREDRERLQLALQAAKAGVWEWFVDTSESRWSPEYYELFGIDLQVLPSLEGWVATIVAEDRDRAVAEAEHAVEAGFLDTEYRIRHPERGIRWINGLGKLVAEPGRPRRMIGISIDVTERHEAEDRLRRDAEELERRVEARTLDLVSATQDMDAFSYSVAHDLRAPLRAIMATAKILIEDGKGRLGAQEMELLERQASAAKRMGLMIDDLLEMARLARTEVSRVDFDFSRLTTEVLQASGAASFEVAPDLRAYADPKLVRTVLSNLVENAVKFAKPSGAVVRVYQIDSPHGAAFCVQDEGIGFDMAFSRRLFRPFERLHGADGYVGNGIGLANCRKIVERHRGHIWADASPGKGARFFFTLEPA